MMSENTAHINYGSKNDKNGLSGEDSHSEQVSMIDSQSVMVFKYNKKKFSLQHYLYYVHNDAISFKTDGLSKEFLKLALKNYYNTFKLFHRKDARAFILNPIFIYELLMSPMIIGDIVSLIDKFLSIMKYVRVQPDEIPLLENTFFKVSQSLEQGTLEGAYASWLRRLYEAQDSSHALLNYQPFIEKQMFSTTLEMSDDLKEGLESAIYSMDNLSSSLPGKEDKDRILKMLEKLPDKEMYHTFLHLLEDFKSNAAHVPDLTKSMCNISKDMAKISGQVDKLSSVAGKKVDKAINFAVISKDVLCCALTTWALFRFNEDKSYTNLILVAACGGITFYYSTSTEAKIFLVTSGILTLVQCFISGSSQDEIEKQMGSLGSIAQAISAFSTFMTSVKWGQLPRKILDFMRLFKELPEFISNVVSLLKDFINSIWVSFYKRPLFTSTNDMSASYKEDLKSILTAYANDDLDHSFSQAKNVEDLIDQTVLYLNLCKRSGDRRVLESNYRLLLEVRKELADVRYSKGGSRQEPVVLMFQGSPGTKKTIWENHLAQSLVSYFKPHLEDKASQVYTKPSGEYWSKYKNQFVTCLDDFGQIRDSLGDPREKGDLINMYNSAPFPLNMNENEDKGKVFFTSEFVLMTANQGWDISPSIISEDALRRRIDISVVVSKIRDSAPVNDTGIEIMAPEDFAFDVTVKGNHKGSLSYQQLLSICVSQYRIKQAHYNLFQRIQHDFLDDPNNLVQGEKDLELKLAEVEAKMNQLLASRDKDNISKQFGELEMESLYQEPPVHIVDEEQAILNKRIIESLPYVKMRIPPIRDGQREYEGVIFDCQYYDDISDIEYTAAIDLMRHYHSNLVMYDNVASKIGAMDRQFLQLHFGEYRTELFLHSYFYATQRFGQCNSLILKDMVSKITREQRGYYMTEFSLLISIWMQDSLSFFKCFFDPHHVLEEMIHYRGFREFAILSDWKLTLRKLNSRLHHFVKSGVDQLSSVIDPIEESISRNISKVFGIHITVEAVQTFVSVAGTLTLLGTVAPPLLYFIGSTLFGDKKVKNMEDQSAYFVRKDASQVREKLSLKQAIKEAATSKQSSSVIPLVQKIEQSAATLSSKKNGVTYCLGKVFYVNTNTIILPLHFYADILTFQEADYIIDDGESQVVLTGADLIINCNSIETEHLELAMVRCDKFKKTRKDHVNSFVSKQGLASLTSKFQVAIYPYTEKVMVTGSAYIGKLTYDDKSVDKMIKYGLDTGKGDCGSLIYLMSPHLGKEIICGFHEAGTPKGSYDKTGAAYIITREDILEALELFESPEEAIEPQSGSTLSPYHHSPYGVTKITASPFVRHGDIVPIKRPGHLMPDKSSDRDPFLIGISKYKRYPSNPCSFTLAAAGIDLLEELTLHEYVPHYGSRIDPALCFFGDPNNPYMKAIPTSTSSGYPYKFVDRNIKREIKEHGPNGAKFQKFLAHVYTLEAMLEKGKRPYFVYTSNLKDQTMKLEKVESYSGRVFFGTPLDLCQLMKMYFGEFMVFMQEDCIYKGTAASVNPHSRDWKTITQYLSEHALCWSDVVCQDFDYAHFDGSNNPDVLEIVLEIINRWYHHHDIGQHNHIRALLFKEVSNFKYIAGNQITEMETSLPSGSYLTLLVNCITNKVLIRYAFIKRFPELRYRDYVRDIVLGDDNVVAVRMDIKDNFTPVNIQQSVAELGFEITLGDKTGVTDQWSTLNDVTFLKRKFVRDRHGIVRAPLSLETLWNVMCWTKKGYLYHQILADNIKFFYREASQHGEVIFLEQTNKLRDILSKYPDYNMYPQGKMSPWIEWDKQVRSTPFFANHLL